MEAPEPLDIKWEYLMHRDEHKMMYRFLSSFLTGFLLFACAILVYIMSRFQISYIRDLKLEEK
jgi:hypothetical protein